MDRSAWSFRDTTFPLPEGRSPAHDSWWDSALASPLPDQVWFSMPTRSWSVARLHILNLATGEIRRALRLAGHLRDAVALSTGDVAVLATHGLHRVDASGEGRHSLRDIPSYATSVIPFANGDRLALGWVPLVPPHRSVPIISVARWGLEARLRIPSVDFVADGGRTLMCSFHGGSARLVDADLRLNGPAVGLPRALSPHPVGGRVWCAPAEVDIAGNVSPPGPKTLRPTGAIVEVDPWTGRVLRERSVFDGRQEAVAPPWPVIAGVDAGRRLVVITPDRRLLLVDTETLEIVAAHEPRVPLGPFAYVPPDRLTYVALSTGRPWGVEMISWSPM